MINTYEKRVLVNYHVDSRRVRLTTVDGYDFAFIPDGQEPSTAAWRYDKHLKRHNIVLNEVVDKVMDRKPKSGFRWRRQPRLTFFKRVFDHEGSHSEN
jgi:hypothetical protein